jgi:DNA-binding beta-propeller fold protein YncE
MNKMIHVAALSLCACLPAMWGQAAAPAPGRPTDRPTDEQVARLKSGPALPYAVDAAWPQMPKGYNFGECSGVDVDKNGNVWVFNRGHWPVIEFDRKGKMLQAWSQDSIPVKSAHGLRVGPDGNIWLVDVEGHVVFKLSREGRVLMVLGNRQTIAGNNDAQDAFNRPTNVAFRADGNFYVSDGYVNSRVVEFTPDGYYVRHWGTKGTGDGQFNLVHDVQVDSRGRVYVGDRLNERIQVFDEKGKFLTKWTDIGSPWGIYYVPKEQAIFMCDGRYDRILKLNLEGQVLGVLSAYGKAPGKLDYAHSIAVDPVDSSLYTVEIKTWRVQKWVKQ